MVPAYNVNYTQDKLSANFSLAHKISARDRVSAGVIVDLLRYQYFAAYTYPELRRERDAAGNTALSPLKCCVRPGAGFQGTPKSVR